MITCLLLGSLLLPAAGQPADAHQRWLEEEVAYIISSREKREFERLETEAQRQAFIQEFWRRRDPDLSTEVNEFQDEHYRRIAEANQKFGNEGRPGWKTERGRVYIIHGPPDDVRYSFGRQVRLTVYNPTQVLNPGGGPAPLVEVTVQSPESETWNYYHLEGVRAFSSLFTVIFAKMDRGPLYQVERYIKRIGPSADAELRGQRDQAIKAFVSRPSSYLRNDYRLIYAGQPRFLDVDDLLESSFQPYTPEIDPFLLHEAESELKRSSGEVLEERLLRQERLRQMVASRVFFGELPLEVGVGFLKFPRGRVHLPLHVRIEVPADSPAESIELLADLQRASDQRPVATLSDEIRSADRGPLSGSISYQSRLVAPPGRYQLRVTAADEAQNRLGYWEQQLLVPDLNTREFGASELVICDRVIPRKEFEKTGKGSAQSRIRADRQAPLSFDEHVFVPAAGHKFRRKENLTALLEVYNPSLDAGIPQVAIQSNFRRANGRVVHFPVRQLDYLTGQSEDTIVYAFTVALRELDPGNYSFNVEITDTPTGHVIRKSVPLQIQ